MQILGEIGAIIGSVSLGLLVLGFFVAKFSIWPDRQT